MTIGKHDRHLALVLAALVLAGCATTESLVAKPDVRLSAIEMSNFSLSGQTFLLSFDVDNPNPFPLPVNSVRYHLSLDGQNFASGESVADFSVPAGGNGAFDISMELDIVRQASSLSTVLRSGMREPLPYRLSGSLGVDIPLAGSLPFSHSGVITVASN